MNNVLNPIDGIRGDIARRGGVPKNHAAENYAKLKREQQRNRVRMADASTVSDPEKSQAGRPGPYAHVQPRVRAEPRVRDSVDEHVVRLNQRQQAERDSSQKHEFIRKGAGKQAAREARGARQRAPARWQPGAVPEQAYVPSSRANLRGRITKPPVAESMQTPSSMALIDEAGASPVNLVAENRRQAAAAGRRVAAARQRLEPKAAPAKHEQHGHVPAYLRGVKQQVRCLERVPVPRWRENQTPDTRHQTPDTSPRERLEKRRSRRGADDGRPPLPPARTPSNR